VKYLIASLCLLTSCGYHISGKADLLPPGMKTVGVSVFNNLTNRYKLSDVVPQAIADEFIARTRYRVVDVQRADAVLTGTVITFTFNPTVFDPGTGRASVAQVHVIFQLTLTDRATGKVLYNRPRFEVTENYQISLEAAGYFDETDAALQRASRQAASQVVSSILQNF
jgi:RNase P/RNase MRP subunit p29